MANADEPPQDDVATILDQAFQKAIACHQAGQVQDAEALYRAVLNIQSDHPEANYNLGVLLMRAGQPAAGLPYFLALLEADPTQGQYWLSYVDALFQAGELETAREALAHAKQQGLQGEEVDALEVSLGTSNESAMLDAVSDAGRTKDAKSARLDKSVGKTTPNKKKRPDAQETKQLTLLFTNGQYEEAVALALAMTARFPRHGFGWKMLGAAYQQMGRGKEAIGPMKKAVELLPSDAAVHSNLGVILNDLDWADEAIASYRRALKIRPDYVMALNNLSNTLHEVGRLEEAAASYRKALLLNPEYAEAHGNLGVTLQGLGRLEEAEASYRHALKIKADFVEAHSNLGRTLQDLGRLEEAEESFLQALQIKPGYAEAHSNLGLVLQAMGRTEEAEKSIRRALHIRPKYAEAYCNLAIILQAMGRSEEAESSYREALAIKPKYPEAYRNLAIMQESLGRLDEAEDNYRQALEMNPKYVDALLSLGHLLSNLDKLPSAAETYRKVQEVDPANRGLEAGVNLAILSYLNQDLDRCRSYLAASQAVLAVDDARNHQVYWRYLDQLLLWKQHSKSRHEVTSDLATLHVIGDSHSLSAQGLVIAHGGRAMRCSTEWIAGCKQWHLANSKPNKFKHKFEAIMARLPQGSTILLTVGEIDCRIDEGILVALKNHPEWSLEDVVQTTVEGYLGFVSTIAQCYDHQLIVAGVPCSNIAMDRLEPDAAEQLVILLRIFNAALKSRALAAGIDFLDVYALTDRGDGVAGEGWHIDDIHLLPDTLVSAFERCCCH